MQIDDDFERFALISQGHSAFQLLWAAVQLGVFEFLDRQPDSGEAEIAANTIPNALEEQPSRILMRGLSALGLVTFRGGTYRNSILTGRYLVRGSPENMIAVLGWQRHIVYPGVTDFTASLLENTNVGLRHFPGTEPELYPRLAHDPMLEMVFHRAMASLSSANNQSLVNDASIAAVHHLADAGGGNGATALALARKYPGLRVTIFDRASVCRQADDAIAKAGLSQRVRTHAGDLFSDAFPEGIDSVLFAHLLTIWSPEKNIELLKRAYDALPGGGKVFVFNMMASDDGTGPISCTLGSVYFMTIATGRGMLYSWNEQTDFLKKAGFKDIKKQVLPHAHGLLIGSK